MEGLREKLLYQESLDLDEEGVRDVLLELVNNPRQNGVDTIIRHKWPEEKPVVPDEVEFKVYLARYKIDDEFIFMDSVAYYKDTGWGTSGVTHWWNLPEVTE